MARRFLIAHAPLYGVALCLLVAPASVPPQGAGASNKADSGVVLTRLATPVYPQLARMAHIVGEVKVTASIRKDGSVESAVATGHPMLKQAALESVHKSTFECRECTEATTTGFFTFSFEIEDEGDCCNAWARPPKVTQSHDRIVIVAPQGCICDPTCRKVRSLKCLYLWRCGCR
jgi:TonB family protein